MANQENEYGVTQAAEPDELTVVDSPEGSQRPSAERPSSGQAGGGSGGSSSKIGLVEEPSEAFTELKAERDQLVDRIARLQAEFDNARKRQEREKQEFRDYATGSVVEQFLPVLDNFALALSSTGTAEQLRTGVELIVKQMDETLRQLQVQTVPTVGQQFDPRLHEALGSVEREDLPDHSVAEEIRKGYRIRERLLRPALVRIVSNPKQTDA
jgi:molecular chaperone GrpE